MNAPIEPDTMQEEEEAGASAASAPKDRVILVFDAGGFGHPCIVCWEECPICVGGGHWAQVDYQGVLRSDAVPVVSFNGWINPGAAPDMLEALKTASWLLADISPDGLVKQKVDAAIAKAEGRS